MASHEESSNHPIRLQISDSVENNHDLMSPSALSPYTPASPMNPPNQLKMESSDLPLRNSKHKLLDFDQTVGTTSSDGGHVKTLDTLSTHNNELGAIDEEDEGEQDAQTPNKKNKIYIFWSFVAAFTMALTSFLRTIVSDTPYSSFFALSFGYLLVSGTVLIILKCVKRDEFRMAWYKKVTQSTPNQKGQVLLQSSESQALQYRFSKA